MQKISNEDVRYVEKLTQFFFSTPPFKINPVWNKSMSMSIVDKNHVIKNNKRKKNTSTNEQNKIKKKKEKRAAD